jgi:iron complex outermembrane receptor protein
MTALPRTRGIELVTSYNRPALGGRMSVDASFSYADTDIRRFEPAPAELQNIDPGFRLVGVEEISTIEEAAPRTKGIATVTWSDERWRILTRWRWAPTRGPDFTPKSWYTKRCFPCARLC